MATTDPPDPFGPGAEDDGLTLAGEFALGVLEGVELAAARERLIADPAFAREVAQWRAHFAAAALAAPAVTPPPVLADRVAAAIARSGPAAPTSPVPLRQAPASAAARSWRWAALGSGAVAAALALVLARTVLVTQPHPPVAQTGTTTIPARPAPVLVAVLDVPAAPHRAHATLLARLTTNAVRVTGTLAVPAAHDAEAWVIDASGTPRALGVLRRTHPGDPGFQTAATHRLAPGQTLAISIEPLGGAPGPLPTGPVIATGHIEQL